jgi:hypothetical protein
VATVNEALALLTGQDAGERGADGHFPEGSVNRRVEERLEAFSERHSKERTQRDGEDDD